jgi:hypothetical protein
MGKNARTTAHCNSAACPIGLALFLASIEKRGEKKRETWNEAHALYVWMVVTRSVDTEFLSVDTEFLHRTRSAAVFQEASSWRALALLWYSNAKKAVMVDRRGGICGSVEQRM